MTIKITKISWKIIFVLFSIMAISDEVLAFCVIGNDPCPQMGTGWTTSSATFNSQIFGVVPANQQATAGEFNNAFQEATTRWNNKSDFSYQALNSAVDPCDTVHSQGSSTQGWGFGATFCGTAFGSSTLAVTRTWANTFNPTIDTITDADIIYNSAKVFDLHAGNQNGSTAGCNPFAGQSFDFARVTAHELGHALGLSHEETDPSLMNPFYSECIENPQVDDFNGLRALYGGFGIVAGNHDFNGDVRSDILLRNTASGQLFLFEMNGNQITPSNIGGLSLDWNVVAIDDFGGDGKADILLRNSSSGQLFLFEMNGNQITASNIGGLSTSWAVQGQ